MVDAVATYAICQSCSGLACAGMAVAAAASAIVDDGAGGWAVSCWAVSSIATGVCLLLLLLLLVILLVTLVVVPYVVSCGAAALYGLYKLLCAGDRDGAAAVHDRVAPQAEWRLEGTLDEEDEERVEIDLLAANLNKAHGDAFKSCRREAELQDAVMRAFLDPELDAQFTLAEREWPIEPGRPHLGVGDLVFQRGATHYVVETKMLSSGSGHTQREQRRQGTRDVKKQARKYAQAWRSRTGATTRAYVCTNLRGLEVVE
jgi:hypothetical protein